MKVFMSWSGELSQHAAEIVRGWPRELFPVLEVFLSSNATSGVPSGTVFFNELEAGIKRTSFGIFCLTRESVKSPWVLFESGIRRVYFGVDDNRTRSDSKRGLLR